MGYPPPHRAPNDRGGTTNTYITSESLGGIVYEPGYFSIQ